MNAPANIRMTVPQFLDWAEARRAHLPYDEPKWELFDGIPEMQEHERWSHGRNKVAIYMAIRDAIARSGLELEVALDSIGVEIPSSGSYRPEVVVFPAGMIGDDDRLAPSPVIVVEVLSPSTMHKDLRIKADGYARVNSIEHYIVADPENRAILHYSRQGPVLTPPAEPITSGLLRLMPPGLDIDVSRCFD
jgi:Uma2 family endonuclease